MPDKESNPHRVSALAHFGSGSLIVVLVALLSASLHDRWILRDLQANSLDVFFLAHQKIQGSDDIAVVTVTDDDYKNLFGRRSPLQPSLLSDLITACGRSGASVIGVDFITSDWTPEQRISAREQLKKVAPKTSLVWADDGFVDTNGKLRIGQLTGLDKIGHSDCEAVPAAIPDQYGVVRGFLPVVPGADANAPPVPSMATLLWAIRKGLVVDGCTPKLEPEDAAASEEKIVNFSGGGAIFAHLTAETVLKASASEGWINSNPLKNHVVLLGGSFREARDRYATPAGYLDGVDILAQTILSHDRKIVASSRVWFTVVDLCVGMLLLTLTWRAQRREVVLVVSFLLIPFIALAASYIAFSAFGYFASFVPIVAGVFLHNLVEHAIEHWKLQREVAELRKHAG